MSEQDRRNANDYHYSNYEKIYNATDLAEAKAIALEEMRIISDDEDIDEDKVKELADVANHN
jgi:hypothetical protein